MMDLLVQVTTANKINPGGHVIQVMNNRSEDFLYYKPSTPIGETERETVVEYTGNPRLSFRPLSRLDF